MTYMYKPAYLEVMQEAPMEVDDPAPARDKSAPTEEVSMFPLQAEQAGYVQAFKTHNTGSEVRTYP